MIRISINRTYLALTAIALLMATCCTGFAQTITEEQAAEAVRAFESNANLEFSSISFDDNSGCSFNESPIYHLYVSNADGNPVSDWDVDAITGVVTSAYYEDAYSAREDTGEPFGSLTKEDCQGIAERFMQARYPGFGQINLELEVTEWERGWDTSWREKLPCGAITSNWVSVCVNSETGEVENYFCVFEPTPNPPDPQITADQAYAIAVKATKLTNPVCEDEPYLFADSDSIVWRLYLTEGQNNMVVYDANVDAITGEVKIDRMVADCAPVAAARRAPKPASQKKPTLRLLRHEMARVPNSSLEWLGHGTVRVVKAGHKFILRNGSSNFTFDGKQANLSRKAEIVQGRFMVPSDFGFTVVKMIAKSSKKATTVKQTKTNKSLSKK